jgi:phage-related protein
MNYIILNGTKSTIVHGLLIQELPPISKPQIRTQVETIDGRDGDIITRLGYSAYDKELTIGLKPEAEINNVISYFSNNDSGKITFSNEPDFYYNFQLLEAIDFERLIRYKQAKVRYHMQPFKYKLSEGNQDLNFSKKDSLTVVNSGNIYSKPILTIRAVDTVEILLNNKQVFTIDFRTTAAETIIIDTAAMEAYDTEGNLKNRIVSGNYDKFYLPIGANVITVTGNVIKCGIQNYSRWV